MTMPPGPPPYGPPPGHGYPPPGHGYPPPGHGYPPPPPQPYSNPQNQFPAPQKKSPVLKWVLVAVAAVVVLAVGGVVAVWMIVSRSSVQATDVKTGDCLSEIPDNSRVMFVKTVPCAEPHKGEVYTVLAMPDGAFPGDAAVSAFTDKCGPAFAQRAPQAADDPAVSVFVLYPTADSWKQGDRTVTCIATTKAPRTGKLG